MEKKTIKKFINEGRERKGGSLSCIYSYGNKIIKFYKGNDNRGFEKIRNEIAYLDAVPINLKEYFPQVLDVLDSREIIAFLTVNYKKMETLTNMLLVHNEDVKLVWKILKNVLDFMDHSIYTRKRCKASKSYLEKSQFIRVESALEILSGKMHGEQLVNTKFLYLNGEKLINMTALLQRIRKDKKILKIMQPSFLSYYHGNLHLANILSDQEKFILIDPRGETIGSSDYDNAKMLCHLYIRYDEIHYGYFNLDKKGDSYNLNLTNLEIGKKFDFLQKHFIQHKQIVSNKDWLKKMQLLMGFHAVSFASYHARQKTVNWKRVTAYYLSGIKLFNDYFNAKEIKIDTALYPYIPNKTK